MSQFVLSPATFLDLPGIAKVSRAAFRESRHTISYWVFPQDNEKAVYEWRLNGITGIFKNLSYCTYIKLVDTTADRIVAFALWEAPHPPETEEEKAKKEQEKKEKKEKGETEYEVPEGTKVQLLHDFDAETERMRAKYVDRGKDYILRAIATLPEYQGRGCASMLLQSGLEKIDAEGAKTFLEATPQGQPVYTKFGWKIVDHIDFDLEKYGCGERVQRITVMGRAAQT